VKLYSTIKIRPDFLYLAPLLNVVMLLLVFFMLNSSFVVRSGVRVDLPVTTSSLRPSGRGMVHAVTITSGAVPRVLLNSEEISPGDLTEKLLSLKGESREVVVSTDSLAPQGLFMRICEAVFAAGCDVKIAGRREQE
jgi:biopolymer transport protein ExbD